jgi:hypothetical protein
MATLQHKHFKEKKKSSGGPYKGQNYQQILDSKIKDKSPFTMGAKEGGTKCYGIAWMIDPAGRVQLSYSNSKNSKNIQATKPIATFFKDSDFGGGKGSGGGSQDTTWTESMQCYYLSILYNTNISKLDNKNATLKALSDQNKFCFTYDKSTKLNAATCYENTPEDWFQKDVFIKTANAIYNSPLGKKFQGKTCYFHRGSPFMKSIYESRKNAFKFDQKNNKPMIAPGTFSDDKWNPGDIWMSQKDPNTKEPFIDGVKVKKTPTEWTSLRETVLNNATKKNLTLGVSLKKVEGANARVVPFNTPKRTHNIDVRFDSFTFGQTGDFFNSADMYITMSNGVKMQLRATATTSSWQGEIKGQFAAGGKIGGGNINFYTENNFNKSIGYNRVTNNWQETKYTSANLANMHKLYKRFLNKQKGVKRQPVVELKEFKAKADAYINPKGKKSAPAFYFGKYMCLLFLETIDADKMSTPLNNFASDIVRYAASNTDISTYFIKVS